MNTLDYLLIAIVLLSAVVGAFRGFLREAISVASWVIALFCAWQFSDVIEPHLGGLLADPHLRTWAARGIIFLAVLLIGAVVGVVLGHFVRVSLFSGLDRFLGWCFGMARGALLIGLLVMAGQLVHLQGEDWWRTSKLLPYAQHVAGAVRWVFD